jgi:hypothetical protein
MMARPKPAEEMTNVSIRAPVSLVETMREKGTDFSSITVAYWRSLHTAPVDPFIKDLQTVLSEFSTTLRPRFKTEYDNDSLAAERIAYAHLALYHMENATPSQIGEVMTRLINGNKSQNECNDKGY